jgi:hypothetical protein
MDPTASSAVRARSVFWIGGDHPIDDVDLLDCAADRLVPVRVPSI